MTDYQNLKNHWGNLVMAQVCEPSFINGTTTPGNDCNLICNPSLIPPTACVFNGALDLSLCPDFQGWSHLTGIPYIAPNSSSQTPSPYINGDFICLAFNDIPQVCSAVEGCVVSADAVMADVVFPENGQYLFSMFAGKKGAADASQFLNINLINSADAANIPCGDPGTPSASLQCITELPANIQNILTTSSFPNTSNINTTMKQIVTTFNIADCKEFDKLFLYPNDTSSFISDDDPFSILFDEVQIVKDVFYEDETVYVDCENDFVLGYDICESIYNMSYSWYIFNTNTNNWDLLPNINTSFLPVSGSMVNTQGSTLKYKVVRHMTGVMNLLGNPSSIFKEAIFTVHVNGFTCCDGSLYDHLNNVTFPFNQSVVWDNNNNPWTGTQTTAAGAIRLNEDLVIPSSVDLTINDMNFEFGPIGRIIVSSGASLTLNNCVIGGDPFCESMWQGIRVLEEHLLQTEGK